MTSIHLEQPQSGIGDRVLQVFAVSANRVAAVWNAARNRRAVRYLREWDDRMLRDIGLTRYDVHAALSGRPTADPSPRLALLADGKVRSAVESQLFEGPTGSNAAAPSRARIVARAEAREDAVRQRYRDLEI